MAAFNQYDIFELAKDLNPQIVKGMTGVVLEVYDQNYYEVEFVNKDGTNYEYQGSATFTIDKSFMKPKE